MHITSIVIDGFKSYGQRTEVTGFDQQFNAITGLNGSGKSNILDAICFLLGITNLSHVRATSMQELVYKNGQAGITKASVTVVFNNYDKSQSPIGYEHYDEITITRQVVIGGKNKYLINGSNVQNNRIQDLFRSIQLNVNNPHFLIMQGRITKVLNMKPPEILSMIEEASGTMMYETKKQQAEKTIEKKDAKLREINNLLTEEITPTLTKLKEERSMYLNFLKVQRELEHRKKLYIAWKFVALEDSSKRSKDEFEAVATKIAEMQQESKDNEAEIVRITNSVTELQRQKDEESGGELRELEQTLKHLQKTEDKAKSELKECNESVKAEAKRQKQVQKSLTDDQKSLSSKKKELANKEDSAATLRQTEKENADALAAANKRFQAINNGLFSSEDGVEATLQEQLINAKSALTQADTDERQANMNLKHLHGKLSEKRREFQTMSRDQQADEQLIAKLCKEVDTLQRNLQRIDFNEERANQLNDSRANLVPAIRMFKEKLNAMESRYPRLNFQHRDRDPNFNYNSVKGVACKLFKMKDRRMATALEVAGGGKLYNIVVDTEQTGKRLLESGQQQRITIIPLNKIRGNPIDKRTIETAERLVGRENVCTALSQVHYDRELHPAMEWIFGSTFICKDLNTAQKVAFHNGIRRTAVTWDGDVVNPAGTLTGGSRASGASILTHVEEMQKIYEEWNRSKQELTKVENELKGMHDAEQRYNTAKQQLDMKSHELELLKERVKQSTHHKHQEEIKVMEAQISELEKTVEKAKETMTMERKKASELEQKMKNSKKLREMELKAADDELKKARKKAEETREQWRTYQNEEETLKIEIKDLEDLVASNELQLETIAKTQEELAETVKRLTAALDEAKASVEDMQQKVKEKKAGIQAQMHEIQKLNSRKDKLHQAIADIEVHVKEEQLKAEQIESNSSEAKNKIKAMLNKYEWIGENRRYFGQPNTAYDFSNMNPNEEGKEIEKLEQAKTKLSRNVNMRAMNMYTKAEEQYNELLRRKRIVETDKAKIEEVIRELDEKKKEALKQAWHKINEDFGSIFSTLLPGARVKLQPQEGRDVLEGLEVKVGFGNKWKDSLSELSGGQRSLVALSLILALLLFKPAPIYILDEVDAALDLSHTQNIGRMIKSHFKHSQFIVVSLKDGMFNNANVLFRTKFVDGMSTVSRTTQTTARK